ncbi:MAG: RNA-binding protein [Rhodospirillales bacterium]|nr:RNA-binding protein [Rhodospirillales bacterium]MSP80707.1 RNA-binding protein [Rhodospirillales bacterium]
MTMAAQTQPPTTPMSPSAANGFEEPAPETGPERRCLASGESGPKELMIRFVVSPAGEVVPDVAGRLPGRGFWLRPEPAMMKDVSALARLFGRAARRPVQVPDDLARRVDGLLAARCLERIGLARRAGRALAGADKVAEALARGQGRGGVVLEAADAGADGKNKMASDADDVRVIRAFTADELGLVFGRARTVHALVVAGGHADALLSDAARLEGLRGGAEAAQGLDGMKRTD